MARIAEGVIQRVGGRQNDRTIGQVTALIAKPVIDTMVTKGIIHANKAARHKRELNAKVKALAAK